MVVPKAADAGRDLANRLDTGTRRASTTRQENNPFKKIEEGPIVGPFVSICAAPQREAAEVYTPQNRSPMDSPKKSWYLLWNVQRKERRPQEI